MKTNKAIIVAVLFATFLGTGMAATSTTATVHFNVPSSYDFTIAYDSNVAAATIYYNSATQTATTLLAYADSASTSLAEGTGADQNLFTVTVTGTANTDLNAYWGSSLPSGVTWKIAHAQIGGGCGAGGTVGYESSCSVTDPTLAPTTSTCKAVSGTAAAGSVIARSITSGAKQGFCAWADFSAKAAGDDSRTLNIKSGEGT